jgi:hypothetical protein
MVELQMVMQDSQDVKKILEVSGQKPIAEKSETSIDI